MRKVKYGIIYISIFVVLILASGTVSAADITVNPGGSIQTAINQASNNDVVILNDNNGAAYTYTENVVIDKDLTLKSDGSVTVQALNASKPVVTVNSGGSGSTISGLTISGAIRSAGIRLNSANNCVIDSNEISDNKFGVYVCSSCENTITGNSVSNNLNNGFNFISSSDNNLISRNTVSGSNYGFYFEDSKCNQVLENSITSNTCGLYFFESVDTEVHFNRIYANQYGIHSDQGSYTNNAQNNWWGHNNPSSESGDLRIDDGTVIYNPWLVFDVSANPGSLSGDNISNITADLTHDNNGSDTSYRGHVPDGLLVDFTTDLGTLISPTYTMNGKATTTFVGSSSGIAKVQGTADSQSVDANISVVASSNTPTITKVYPQNGGLICSVDVEYESVLIVFSEPIQAGPAFNNIKIVGQDYNGYNSRNININKSISGSSLTLTPDSFWASGDYTVTVPVNSIKNMAGNGLAMVFISNFRADTTPPTLTATPAGGNYTGGQVVTLTATDNLDPNPSIYYSTNGGIPNMRYTGPISISNTTTLKFRADDTSGNTSFKKVIYTIATDTTPPMVSASPAGGTYSTAQTVTLTVTDNLDPNPAIFYTLNGTAPTTSSSRYTGPISVGSSLSLSFMAVDASGNSCPVQTLIYTILPPSSSADSVYSFEIPTSTLVTIQGSNVKIGVSRIIRVDTPTGYYLFTSGNIDGVTPGSAIELYSGYYNRISNFSISCNYDCITISYYGDLNEYVNQVSAIYRQGDYPEYEAVDIVKNGLKQLSINFSMTLPRYDDTEIRYLLYDRYYHQDTGIWPPEEGYLDWNYQQLCHNHPIPSMKFANTGEDVIYNSSLDMITNSPSLEYINSKMTYNNTTINKQETITYNNDPEAGFECMQSFAITNTKVTNSMVQFWLNKKSEYPEGAKKAAYGTFMTALTTLWLSDKYADGVASQLNVSWDRTAPTVVMSGVTNGGTAYVNCLDPAMGMSVTGDTNNTKSFRFVCSLLLSEIEQGVLGSTGASVNSTVSGIVSGILEGEPFSVTFDTNNNTATLTLDADSRFKIIIDLNTGLVKDILDDQGLHLKGADTSTSSYCYHDQMTDNADQYLQNFYNGFKESGGESVAGGLLITAGLIAFGACPPLGLLLIAGGLIISADASNLFQDPTDPYNWVDFGASVGLSLAGPEAVTLKAAITPTFKTGMRLAVEKYGYKTIVHGTLGSDSGTAIKTVTTNWICGETMSETIDKFR